MNTRTEKDSLGEIQVPANAYYGAQTQRAIQNFPISGEPLPKKFIHAHVMLKKAAATVNRDLGLLNPDFANAIIQAADEILHDAEWSKNQFPVDIYQTGSGTSTNMNVNEVLAIRANQILASQNNPPRAPHGNAGLSPAQRDLASFPRPIHPNDHVNLGQSSNDTFPTSIQVMAATMLQNTLRPVLKQLAQLFRSKSSEFWNVVKTGRTHLQDATPIRLGQEFLGFAGQIEDGPMGEVVFGNYALRSLPLGGTAVGTGVNGHPEFAPRVAVLLSEWSGLKDVLRHSQYFKIVRNHFWAQACLDTMLTTHAMIRTVAVSLTKIANDIRWMSSGPRAGLGEIELPAVQPGSSIMPGKVNPVIAESVLMVCQRVIGNDAALTAAATQCNFELAMSMPLAAKLLHESITLLANACENFAKNCIDGITATTRGPELVEKGLMLATALVPAIGYDAAAKIAKEAAQSNRTIREVASEKTTLTPEELNALLNPEKMVDPQPNPPV